jgi:hypothetical protein
VILWLRWNRSIAPGELSGVLGESQNYIRFSIHSAGHY